MKPMIRLNGNPDLREICFRTRAARSLLPRAVSEAWGVRHSDVIFFLRREGRRHSGVGGRWLIFGFGFLRGIVRFRRHDFRGVPLRELSKAVDGLLFGVWQFRASAQDIFGRIGGNRRAAETDHADGHRQRPIRLDARLVPLADELFRLNRFDVGRGRAARPSGRSQEVRLPGPVLGIIK